MSHSTYVMPAEVGITAGVVGAGAGYVFAPRKYNLERLLTLKPDVFEKSIPKERLLKADNEKRTAHKAIKEARTALEKAAKQNTHETKLVELLRAPDLNKSYKAVKELIPRARTHSAIVFGIAGAVIGTLGTIIFGRHPNN